MNSSRHRKACYAGTFNPIHDGHVWIVKQALKVFDQVHVLVANNPEKIQTGLEERMLGVNARLKDFPDVIVSGFMGLTVEYCNIHNIGFLVRGIRNDRDIDHEAMVQDINFSLDPGISTLYFMAPPDLRGVSSTSIRKALELGA